MIALGPAVMSAWASVMNVAPLPAAFWMMIWFDLRPAASSAFLRYGASNSVQRVDDTVSGRITATFPLPFLASGTRAFIAENEFVKSAEVRFLYVTAGFAALAATLSVANSVPVRATATMATNTRLLFSRDILFPLSRSHCCDAMSGRNALNRRYHEEPEESRRCRVNATSTFHAFLEQVVNVFTSCSLRGQPVADAWLGEDQRRTALGLQFCAQAAHIDAHIFDFGLIAWTPDAPQ